MTKTLFKISMVCLSVVVLSGCATRPKADLWGSNGNMIGSGAIEGNDLPMISAPIAYPDSLNREMFPPLLFAYDSSQVSAKEADKVEQVAEYLQNTMNAAVIIEGHGDERGSHEYNLALGERRALAVREYLITLGIDSSRIQTNSKGEEDPATLGHDEASWQQNRRAVFGIH